MPTVIKTIETHFGTHLHKPSPWKLRYSNREWQSVSFTVLLWTLPSRNNHGNREGTQQDTCHEFLDRFFLSFFFFFLLIRNLNAVELVDVIWKIFFRCRSYSLVLFLLFFFCEPECGRKMRKIGWWSNLAERDPVVLIVSNRTTAAAQRKRRGQPLAQLTDRRNDVTLNIQGKQPKKKKTW